MTDLLATWLSGFAADPALLAAAALAVLAWLFAMIVIVRRSDGWLMRVVLSLTSAAYVLALFAFILPPSLPQSLGGATLVTGGADGEALSSVAPAADVYITDRAWRESAVAAFVAGRNARSDSGRTVRIASLADLETHQPGVERLRVIGFGLGETEWFESDVGAAIDFSAKPIGAGILDALYPAQLAAGERLTVDVVTLGGTQGEPLELMLVADDERELARAKVSPDGATRLGVDGLKPGVQLLRLRLIDSVSGVSLEAVTLPVRVIRPPAARLLMLQGAPSFEWRALSRWALDVGAAVAARVTVSEARFRVRSSPALAIDPATIDRRTLTGVDLVILDGAALGALSDAERNALLDPSHGAGVLVLVHDAADAQALPASLAALLSPVGDSQIIYRLDGMGGELESGLTREPLAFDESAVSALLRDERKGIVAARAAEPSHVALSLMRDSYRMAGVGLGELHAQTWSRLVKALARPIVQNEPAFQQGVSRAGQRLRVCVPAGIADERLRVEEADAATYEIALHESDWRPGERCGWLWPRVAGWLRVNADGLTRGGAHYVATESDWLQRERQRRVTATLARAGTSAAVPTSSQPLRAVTMPRDWPLIVLLALSLLAWLIQRLAIAQPDRRDPH